MQVSRRKVPLEQVDDPVDLIAYNLNLLQGQILDLEKVTLPSDEFVSDIKAPSYPNDSQPQSRSPDSRQQMDQDLDLPGQEEGEDQGQGEGEEDSEDIEKAIVQHLREQYNKFMQRYEQEWQKVSYTDKMELLLTVIEAEGQHSVGAYVYLFELLYHFRDQFQSHQLAAIVKRVARGIGKGVKGFCVLEIIAAVGQGGQEQMGQIAKLLLDEQQPFLQEKAFLALLSMGYPGIYTLVDIANKDYTSISGMVLSLLAKAKVVQQRVFFPVLLPRVTAKQTKLRQEALSILLRLDGSAVQSQSLKLAKSVHGHPECGWLSQLLATAGQQSAKALLRQLRGASPKEKVVMIQALGQDLRSDGTRLKIQIVSQSVNFPGQLFRYEGCLGPATDGEQEGVLRLDLVDFMASLHQLMNTLFLQYQQGKLEAGGLAEGMGNWFTLLKVIDSKVQLQSSHQNLVLKLILNELAHDSADVRKAVLLTISKLKNVNFVDGTQKLLKAMGDKDQKVRGAACQVISRSTNPPQRLVNKMIQLLRDSFWNVRVSACMTLGMVVKEPSQYLLESLVRCLKEGTINRNVVCSTLAKMGVQGVSILLQILKMKSGDPKLKAAVVAVLGESKLDPAVLDSAVKQLFTQCRCKSQELRESALQAIHKLYNCTTQNQSVYLKARSLMPLLYELLTDHSDRIRKLCIDFLVEFGAQAQLLLVEGLTKDESWVARVECAKGLARLGGQNFRALLFGLRDEDERVRRGTAQAMMGLGGPDSISSQYVGNPNQVPTILSNIADILSSRHKFGKGVESLLRGIQVRLQTQRRGNKENDESNMRSLRSK